MGGGGLVNVHLWKMGKLKISPRKVRFPQDLPRPLHAVLNPGGLWGGLGVWGSQLGGSEVLGAHRAGTEPLLQGSELENHLKEHPGVGRCPLGHFGVPGQGQQSPPPPRTPKFQSSSGRTWSLKLSHKVPFVPTPVAGFCTDGDELRLLGTLRRQKWELTHPGPAPAIPGLFLPIILLLLPGF